MKRFFLLTLTLLFALSLGVSVFAAEEDCVLSVSVGVTAPAADSPASEARLGEAKANAVVDGVPGRPLGANVDYEVGGHHWKEKDSGLVLQGEDLFVSGRKYVFEVEFTLVTNLPVTAETVFTLGGKEATVTPVSETKFILSREFVAVPADFEPKVTMTTEGNLSKEFDGKAVTLTASVEKIDGIHYSFAWYRDMVLVEEETSETMSVRDVRQSGNYYCVVTAGVADDPTVPVKSARTTAFSVEIRPTLVTVQIENAEKNLSDPDPRFSYTVLGNVHDPLHGALERKEGEDIGKYAILIGTLRFAEDKIANYQIVVKQGTLTILDVGELPFSAVADIADLSYIAGAQRARIRVSASKGAIPEGAILSLATASAEARAALEKDLGATVMKAFRLSIVSSAGKEISLPRHGSLRIQIPLTAEEAALDTATISAGFFDSDSSVLDTFVSEEEGVTYINVEISSPGTVALFDGEARKTADGSKDDGDGEKDGGSVLLWVVIAVVGILAIGGIAFTVVFTLKNRKPQPKKKAPAVAEDELAKSLSMNDEEKKRGVRIAEELNEKSPVPTKEKPPRKPKKTVVSFEDLED